MSDKEKFANFIISSQIFILVHIQEKEDEQKIFDSINSTGEKLTATDIIKNAIFDKIQKKAGRTVAINLYKQYWRNVFDSPEQFEFWNTQSNADKTARVNSEHFFRYIAIIFGIYDATKHRLEQLSSIYKSHLKDKESKDLEELLSYIQKYAAIMQNKILAVGNEYSFSNKTEMFLHTLREFEANTFMPLALLLFDKLRNHQTQLHKSLNLIQCFIVYRAIIKCETSSYNKTISTIINQLKNKDANEYYDIIYQNLAKIDFYGIPNLQTVKRSLIDIKTQQKRLKYILFWIELFRRKAVTTDKCNYENFKLQYLNEKDQDKPETFAIGNITLLEGAGFNKKLAKADWHRKLYGNGKAKQCISSNRHLYINRDLEKYKKWEAEEINIRSNELIRDFFHIYKLDENQYELINNNPQEIQDTYTHNKINHSVLRVNFPLGGGYIQEKASLDTFIRTIEIIGFQLVMLLRITVAGVYLIDTKHQGLLAKDGSERIRQYNGYFVYINLSNIVIPKQNSSLLPLQLYCSYELHFEDIF